VIPLVTAVGAGAESRKVIGLSVFAGLLVATALAVCLVPVFFVLIERYLVRSHPTASAGGQEAQAHAAPEGGAH